MSIGSVIGRGIGLLIDRSIEARQKQQQEELRRRYRERFNNLLEEHTRRFQASTPTEVIGERPRPSRQEISVGCLPCARAHLATIAGSLKEALRFARGDERGILHPEVQTRLQAAEEEITAIERHDWTPEKILASPPEQQEVIRQLLPELRELRQDIIEIQSVEDLERAAARAAELSVRLRMEVLRLKGLDTSKIVELAQRVANGEMTVEEAKAELRDGVAKGEQPAEEEHGNETP